MQSRNDGLDFGLPPEQESYDYDEWALQFKRMADQKFKGQRLRRAVKKGIGFCVELALAWVVVTLWLWLGVTMFLTKFNALDHLSGIRVLDWAEMGAFATVFIYIMVRLFRFALED